jgi:hypothetical protein
MELTFYWECKSISHILPPLLCKDDHGYIVKAITPENCVSLANEMGLSLAVMSV